MKTKAKVHQVRFNGTLCDVKKTIYDTSRRIALLLTKADTGEPWATATINNPEVILNKDEVIIKDYSENSGMLKALQNAKIISMPTRDPIQTGFVSATICKCLI